MEHKADLSRPISGFLTAATLFASTLTVAATLFGRITQTSSHVRSPMLTQDYLNTLDDLETLKSTIERLRIDAMTHKLAGNMAKVASIERTIKQNEKTIEKLEDRIRRGGREVHAPYRPTRVISSFARIGISLPSFSSAPAVPERKTDPCPHQGQESFFPNSASSPPPSSSASLQASGMLQPHAVSHHSASSNGPSLRQGMNIYERLAADNLQQAQELAARGFINIGNVDYYTYLYDMAMKLPQHCKASTSASSRLSPSSSFSSSSPPPAPGQSAPPRALLAVSQHTAASAAEAAAAMAARQADGDPAAQSSSGPTPSPSPPSGDPPN